MTVLEIKNSLVQIGKREFGLTRRHVNSNRKTEPGYEKAFLTFHCIGEQLLETRKEISKKESIKPSIVDGKRIAASFTSIESEVARHTK